jgi:cob(I)alamin adenosyltransferase
MVRLTRIYTKGGDRGTTALGDGTRVLKTHPRIGAYGAVDELNAVLGWALTQRGLVAVDRKLLRRVQNDLFDVGADLCVPRRRGERSGEKLRVVRSQVEELEQAIDARNERLEALNSFVLPGGSPLAAALHLARVVCRRAEVAVVRLFESEPPHASDQVLRYLNRLSDLLFVMARCANRNGRDDVLWQPGAGRTEEPRRSEPRARRRESRRAASPRSSAAASGAKRGRSRRR